MNKRIRSTARRVGITAVAVAALSVAGCATSVEGTATAAGSALADTTAPYRDTDRGRVDLDLDVEIGDCVRLGGTADDATVDEAVCGSADSNYKVVEKTARNAQCPSDVDQVYYETKWGDERGALCLDVDWVIGGCMSIPDGEDDEPRRVDCNDPHAPGIERAVEIIDGATDAKRCSDGGFVHDEREFTVCTETVRPL
ncbi:hypothetical protein C8K36_102313 [Rhodococcus sp. OK519]|nr:hypothetical protein C8K36_102313 [Rhodococcus sp. OK519]